MKIATTMQHRRMIDPALSCVAIPPPSAPEIAASTYVAKKAPELASPQTTVEEIGAKLSGT
jgi:hypothetical protein